MEAFPVYTRTEFAADRAVHVAGVALATIAVVWLPSRMSPAASLTMPGSLGVPLCAVVWALAVLGIVLEHVAAGIARLVSLPLYFGMGWLVLGFLPSLSAAIGLLLLAGGIFYSADAALQAHGQLPFHNAIWHAMIVAAAGLHFAAIALLLPPAG